MPITLAAGRAGNKRAMASPDGMETAPLKISRCLGFEDTPLIWVYLCAAVVQLPGWLRPRSPQGCIAALLSRKVFRVCGGFRGKSFASKILQLSLPRPSSRFDALQHFAQHIDGARHNDGVAGTADRAGVSIRKNRCK